MMGNYRLTMTVTLEAETAEAARLELYRWLDSTADLENLAQHADAKRLPSRREAKS